MPVNVSVIIVAQDNGRAVQNTLESLDVQTMSTNEYNVIVVDNGSRDETRDRLQYIADRRVNLRLIDAADDDAIGPRPLVDGLVTAEGRYVLVLEAGDTALPNALADLVAHAEKTSSDVVIGRTINRKIPVLPPIFARTADVHVVDADLLAAGTSAALLRRTLVTDDLLDFGVTEGSRDLLVMSALLAAATVAVYADRPVVTVEGAASRPHGAQLDAGADHLGKVTDADDPTRENVIAAWRSPTNIAVDGPAYDTSLAWRDAALRVTVASPRRDLLVTARHAESGTIWPLVGQTSTDWLLDAQTGAAGAPLPRGTWEIHVQSPVDAQGGEDATAEVAVARARYRGRARTALVESRAVIAYRDHDGHLSVDVDTARRSLVNAAHPDAALATVSDTPGGTTLELPLPEVAVRGRADQDGHLIVGGFALPARIIADRDGARLIAGLSALPGTYELRTRFRGVSGATPLTLEVGPAGTMRIVPTPSAEKPDTRAEPTATSAPTGMLRVGQAVVRRVPALRPLALKVRRTLR